MPCQTQRETEGLKYSLLFLYYKTTQAILAAKRTPDPRSQNLNLLSSTRPPVNNHQGDQQEGVGGGATLYVTYFSLYELGTKSNKTLSFSVCCNSAS